MGLEQARGPTTNRGKKKTMVHAHINGREQTSHQFSNEETKENSIITVVCLGGYVHNGQSIIQVIEKITFEIEFSKYG